MTRPLAVRIFRLVRSLSALPAELAMFTEERVAVKELVLEAKSLMPLLEKRRKKGDRS